MYPWYLVACAWYYGIPVPGTAILYVPFERHIYILALKKREAMPHQGRRDTGASCVVGTYLSEHCGRGW